MSAADRIYAQRTLAERQVSELAKAARSASITDTARANHRKRLAFQQGRYAAFDLALSIIDEEERAQ